jgi:hypothetical protein
MTNAAAKLRPRSVRRAIGRPDLGCFHFVLAWLLSQFNPGGARASTRRRRLTVAVGQAEHPTPTADDASILF